MITVDQITFEAFPKDDCRFKEAHKAEQRLILKNRINQYLSEQLSHQWNAKPFLDTIRPGVQGVTDGRQEMQ